MYPRSPSAPHAVHQHGGVTRSLSAAVNASGPLAKEALFARENSCLTSVFPKHLKRDLQSGGRVQAESIES